MLVSNVCYVKLVTNSDYVIRKSMSLWTCYNCCHHVWQWSSSVVHKVGFSVLPTICYGHTTLTTCLVWQTRPLDYQTVRWWARKTAFFALFPCKGGFPTQGDHSPCQAMRNSLTIPWWLAALGMLSVTHIMPEIVLNTCMDANMQLTINSFRQLFPDKIFPWHFRLLVKSLTFSSQLSNSPTFPGFPDKWSPCLQPTKENLVSKN